MPESVDNAFTLITSKEEAHAAILSIRPYLQAANDAAAAAQPFIAAKNTAKKGIPDQTVTAVLRFMIEETPQAELAQQGFGLAACIANLRFAGEAWAVFSANRSAQAKFAELKRKALHSPRELALQALTKAMKKALDDGLLEKDILETMDKLLSPVGV